ncbi:hypothetical protein Neosp_000088 [[Neocosmospora] mangrovei]
MECFCHKLRTQRYHEVTETETAILKRTLKEAAHLFQANPLTPPDTERPVARARRKRSGSSLTPRVPKQLRKLPSSYSTSVITLRARDQSRQVTTSLSSSARDLVKTYSYQNAVKTFRGGKLEVQQKDGDTGLFVRIFLAIEGTDQKIEVQQLFRRTCCYGFAQLHEKGTSIDQIVHEIEDALPHDRKTIRQKVYNIHRIGAKWVAIIQQFASILQRAPQQLTGLLCLLGSPSTAKSRVATNGSCPVERSFVDETPKFTLQSQSLLGTIPMSRSSRNSPQPGVAGVRRDLHIAATTQTAWETPQLTTVLEAAPGPVDMRSDDAKVMLTLLSFFSTPDSIPLDLLSRGAAPRKRWTTRGGVEEVDTAHTGLAPELHSLLLDGKRLGGVFDSLGLSSVVSRDHDQNYTLDETVATRVHDSVPPEDLPFWRSQALIISYRAIPWKYIEPATPSTKLFLPHLKHALQACQDSYDFLSTSTRTDLVLTLVEASRFPNMAWKRFAVSQAEIASHGLAHPYLECRIAQSQSLLSRIAGDMDHATRAIGNPVQTEVEIDKRMHSALGQATIQRALNCIQVEDLSVAKELLEQWTPLDKDLSLVEQVTVFRKDVLLGRILRFLGAFKESLVHLERARGTVENCKDLLFDEDLCDLTCEHSDTLRELDDPGAAEQHLRAEIARQDQNGLSSGKSRLEISLAEALFAQGLFQEAEKLCLDVQSRPGLLKFEKLRLHITLAKIRHVQSDNEGALSYWSGAMKEIGKFKLTNGRATRIIVISICDTLSGLGQTWLVDESLKQVESLDEMAKPGGTQHWIAGMRHWLEYLESRSLRSHTDSS